MDVSKIKLVAFDLDGTLTQHKTPLSEEHRKVLSDSSTDLSEEKLEEMMAWYAQVETWSANVKAELNIG